MCWPFLESRGKLLPIKWNEAYFNEILVVSGYWFALNGYLLIKRYLINRMQINNVSSNTMYRFK